MRKYKSIFMASICVAGLSFQSAAIADTAETPNAQASTEVSDMKTIHVGQSYQANTNLGEPYVYESTVFTLNGVTTVSKSGIYSAKQPGILKIYYNFHYSDPNATHPSIQPASADVKILPETASEETALYRLYNPNSGEHFYTHSFYERDSLVNAGWKNEGIAEQAPVIDTSVPVYRVYNPNSGLHHFTTGLFEKNQLVSLGWRDEGIGWYSNSDPENGISLYRVYNPNSGQHLYTTGAAERDKLVSLGWNDEEVAWYALK
ncbi:MAG: hypothetical protein LBV19_02035 [Streptococcaceae bacterium]|jgi:hypothetical protein|nr:hypothetical protein [Streptococcaceae bacterium]